MKKVIVLIGLVTSLMITGCTKSEESKEEVVSTIVYCDSCGEESKEVTKFCSTCGEEAKWLAEKPEKVQKEEVEEVEKTEEIDKKEESTKENIEYVKCIACGKEEDKQKINHVQGYGYIHKSCYDSSQKCSYCNRSLLPGDDDDSNGVCWSCDDKHSSCKQCGDNISSNGTEGYCESCWVYNAPPGTFGCFTGNEDACHGCYYYGEYCLDNK